MDLRNFASLTIIALMFIAGAYVYPNMPELVATHWDIDGNVDGYSSRTVGIFLFPVVTFGIYLLFLLIPKIAVYKKNIQQNLFYFYGRNHKFHGSCLCSYIIVKFRLCY